MCHHRIISVTAKFPTVPNVRPKKCVPSATMDISMDPIIPVSRLHVQINQTVNFATRSPSLVSFVSQVLLLTHSLAKIVFR